MEDPKLVQSKGYPPWAARILPIHPHYTHTGALRSEDTTQIGIQPVYFSRSSLEPFSEWWEFPSPSGPLPSHSLPWSQAQQHKVSAFPPCTVESYPTLESILERDDRYLCPHKTLSTLCPFTHHHLSPSQAASSPAWSQAYQRVTSTKIVLPKLLLPPDSLYSVFPECWQ